MSATLNLSKPHRPIHVGVILVNSKTEILDVAPVDYFSAMTADFIKDFPVETVPDEMKAQAVPFEFHWVPLHNSYEDCPPLDIVLMGACEVHYKPTEADIAFIRKSYEDCSAFITICGGFMVPMQAGLFEGKTVTGPRPMLDTLRQTAPGSKWLEKRWVRDGKLWSSGTLLNGLDLMYAFTTHYWGGEGSLIERLSQFGAWPNRDIDYKDVAWIY
ncbi:Isonitrile hydratase [Paramyrothecium foliicola]|nr:Isonitrile hydratase [Paramyrothecium foliicola]